MRVKELTFFEKTTKESEDSPAEGFTVSFS
jgi:hypothetical protein